MKTVSMNALDRRKIALLAFAGLAFGGFAAWRTLPGAQAHETTAVQKMNCSLAGAITVNYTMTHVPTAGAIAGELFTLNVSNTVEMASALVVPIKSVAVTLLTPTGTTAAGEITASGGNLKKAGQTNSGAETVLNLTADAGVTSTTMAFPSLSIPLQIPAAAAGTPIAIQGPSKIALTVEVAGNELTETCAADAANTPLLTVTPTAPDGGGATTMPSMPGMDHGTPTTTPGPTTPAPTTPATTAPGGDHGDHGDHGTPTTAPPTTKAPSTTKAPATTSPAPTTRPAPPTTKAPTATTKPSSGGGGGGGGDHHAGSGGADDHSDVSGGELDVPESVVAMPTYTG